MPENVPASTAGVDVEDLLAAMQSQEPEPAPCYVFCADVDAVDGLRAATLVQMPAVPDSADDASDDAVPAPTVVGAVNVNDPDDEAGALIELDELIGFADPGVVVVDAAVLSALDDRFDLWCIPTHLKITGNGSRWYAHRSADPATLAVTIPAGLVTDAAVAVAAALAATGTDVEAAATTVRLAD